MRNLKRHIGWTLVLASCLGTAPVAWATPTADCKKATNRCHVLVTVVVSGGNCGSTVKLDPEKVSVSKYERHTDYRVIWILPVGYVFRPAMGDGITIQKDMLDQPDDHGEFARGDVAKDDDGDTGHTRGRRYRLEYYNSVGESFKYKIQFREDKPGGLVYSCDPTITNLEAN